MSDDRGGRRGETARNLLLSAATVVVFLGGLEGVARLLERRAAPETEVAPYIIDWQDWDGDFYTVKSSAVGMPPWEDYNHDGLRDREHALAKPAGVRRLVCLGDSTTLGWGIRPEQAYPQVLQDLLDAAGERVEVFNVGLGGWSTRQELIAYRKIARKYRPDQVLLAICLNDVAEMQNNLARPPALVAALHRRSAFVRFLVGARAREIRDVTELFTEPDAPRVREGFARMFADLRTLRDETRRDGADLAVLVFPFALQIAPTAPPPTAQRTILDFCQGERIPGLDLLPALRAAGPEAFIDYDHFSPSGARLVAERVLDWGLISPAVGAREPEDDRPGGLAVPRGAPASEPAQPLLATLAALRAARTDRERIPLVRAIGQQGAGGGAAVAALSPLLRDPSPDVRAAAAWAIGGMGPEAGAVLPSLVRALGDGDPRVRAGAAWSLGRLREKARPAALPLLELLGDPDPTVRWRVGDALTLIGPEPATALPPLLAVLESGREAGRAEAIEAIGRLGPSARSAVPALARCVSDPRDDVRSRAVVALGQIGPEAQAAVPALRGALGDLVVRWRAADALGAIGAPAGAAVPDLVAILHDPASSVRWRAAQALGRIGGPAQAAAPDLVALVDDPDVKVRVAALTALSDLQLEPASTLPVFSRALEDPDPHPRSEAANALARMGPAARVAVPDLAAHLQDGDSGVRAKAARALGRIGGLPPAVVRSLTELRSDVDERVRFEAARALERAAKP